MAESSWFHKTPTWTVEQVRAYMERHQPEEYTLLDVRQPEEYEAGHLPGSRLIPVGELNQRLHELDRARPTIVYCRSGMRSGNATGLLLHAGLKEVRSMAGGLLAWQGTVATGAPEAGMWWFDEARDPETYLSLAWILEEGTKIFYGRMADRFAPEETANLFRTLVAEEENHKDTLRSLYEALTGRRGDPVSPDEAAVHDAMESGTSITRVLAWAEGQKAIDVLEFSVAMEVNSYDLYLKMAQRVDDTTSKDILLRLAREEKTHLDGLTEAFLQQGKRADPKGSRRQGGML
jgi:sulfur-carrier protein adenylyltransferase/sulfurtransferase